MHVKRAIPNLYIQPSIGLEKVHFVCLYCVIMLQCPVQKYKITKSYHRKSIASQALL